MTGTPGTRALIGWIWREYLRRRSGLLLVAVLLMAVEGSTVGVLSYLVRPMFDTVFVGGTRAAVLWVAFGVAAVFILRAIAGFGQRVIMARLGEGFVADMQSDLLAHMMTLDLAFYQDHPPGSLIERVRGDTGTLRALFASILAAMGRDLVALLSLLAVALWVDWVWTLVAVMGVPLIVLPVVALQKRVRGNARAAREAAAQLSTRLDEIFHGISTVQLTGSAPRETARYRSSLNRYIKVQMRSERGAAAIPALIDLVAAVGFAGVMAYGGLQIIAGTKTVGEFMSFFTAMALVFEPLRRLGAVSGAWAQARASLDRLRGVLDRPTAIAAPAVARAMTPGDLVLTDVHFAYGTAPVLRGLTLTAAAGKTTALVGPSGAGKSTVFALLTRMADPQAGRITLGGTDLAAMDPAALRRQFSVVSQDAALFDETIRDNVLLGRDDLSPAALEDALQAAHVTTFAGALPLGLDTPAGPRGSGLSGGQRQRVAIARALVRNAPILLLDEATSALDAQSEALVTDALTRLAQGRTTLVIAHRLATVQGADHIVVMDKGRVVDTGRHDDLIARPGLYADLYRLQFKL